MNILITLILLFSCLSLRAKVQSYSLNYKPYSSTYLPYVKGEIVNTDHPMDNILSVMGTINGLNQEALNKSVLHKFDEIRQNLTTQEYSLVENYGDKFFDTKKYGWEGFCNRWSAANTNPIVPELIHSTSGIICDGILLSRGELKELFTALYKIDEKYVKYYGKRNYSEDMPGGKAYSIYQELGYDDLAAHTLHHQLVSNLSKNESIVIEIDSSIKVWNHPVVAMETNEEVVSFDDILKNEELFIKMPSYIYEITESNIEEDKDQVKEQIKTQESLSKLKEIEKLLISRAEKRNNKGVSSSLRKRRKLLKRIRSELTKDDGTLNIGEGYQFRSVKNTLTIALESHEFANESGETKESKAGYPYEYILIEKNGEVVDSFWLTAPRERPDNLWKPTISIDEINKDSEEIIALVDLLDLIKNNKCTKIERADEFFKSLEPLLASSVFQENWLKVEKSKFKDIIRYIPEDAYIPLEEKYGRSLEYFYKDYSDSRL